mgnify:FL=1
MVIGDVDSFTAVASVSVSVSVAEADGDGTSLILSRTLSSPSLSNTILRENRPLLRLFAVLLLFLELELELEWALEVVSVSSSSSSSESFILMHGTTVVVKLDSVASAASNKTKNN